MKKIIAPLLFLSFTISAQDSTRNSIVTSLSIASKNFWRGNVYGDNLPTLSGTLAYRTKSNTEIGAIGTSPLTGARSGYGTWMELYASQVIGRFTFTIDDYYFFNAYDSLNDYFNWGRNETQHLVEGRVKYDAGRFNIMSSYVVYAATAAVNSLYLEGEYFLIPKLLSLSAGASIGQSALNFFDKGGVTFVGVTGYKDIRITDHYSVPMKMALLVSPNYKNAFKAPGFTQNPVNFVVGFSF
ncbi:hypothetical protein WSM22_03690 [Cytophagales bacterium WSM2-2]|nr:hypothetical protein WSM22_03690 [Cytophagales bacterium WSM2-2]